MDGLYLALVDGLSLGLDVEHAPLHLVTVEHGRRSLRIVCRRKEHGAEATRLAIGSRGDVGTDDDASRSEQVLEVLPLHCEGEILDKADPVVNTVGGSEVLGLVGKPVEGNGRRDKDGRRRVRAACRRAPETGRRLERLRRDGRLAEQAGSQPPAQRDTPK
jgi:hypothetical protein